MSVVNPPTSQVKERFSSPIIIDDNSSNAERQLCDAVDAMLAGVSRVLQLSTSERNAKARLQGATASFLRANGIRIAQENDGDDNNGATAGRAPLRGSSSINNGSSSDAEAALRTQLEHCRDLLRKVDSERRHLRKQHVHLQGEQEQRSAEVEAIRRYSTESYQRSLTLEHHVAEERQRRRQLEEQLDTQTQELMQLRRVLRAIPGDLVTALSSPKATSSGGAVDAASSSARLLTDAAHPLVPDRRFEEAFRDKMNSIVYKRRYRQASTLHQAAREQLEALRMEQQDPQYAGLRWGYGGGGTGGTPALTGAAGEATSDGSGTNSAALDSAPGPSGVAELQTGANSSTAAALASAVFWQSALDFPFQLPFSTATPQDALIKSLVYRSRYAEPLTQLREHTLRLSSRLKTTQDAGLRTLYMTFNQALQRLGPTAAAQAQCRSLYERQMDKMQRAHRELLYSLIEQVNHAATAIPELEHGGRGTGTSGAFGASPSSAVQRRDVGCSAQDSVSVEEYRASQLREQLTKLKLQSLEAAAAALQEKESSAAQCTAARHEALQALQSLKKLTTGVVAAVQAQKGPTAGAADTVYDPLEQVREPITEAVLDDPRLVTKMAEATDLTLTYVRRLARLNASLPLTPSTTAAAAAGGGDGQPLSPPRARTNLAASARLSSTLTFDADSTREATYGHIIDIHRRNNAFSAEPVGSDAAPSTRRSSHHHHLHQPLPPGSTTARSDRRKSAPSSLNTTLRRPRSRSAAALANRRQTVPQLPTVAKTPTAPAVHRGARGRPERGGDAAAAAPLRTPPLEEQTVAVPRASLAGVPHDAVMRTKESPAKPEGRSPNAAITVIELGFSEDNIRYT